MYSTKEKRYYKRYHEGGRVETMIVEYTLFFNEDNYLIDVRNEYGYAVELKSECWEHFDSKYNCL